MFALLNSIQTGNLSKPSHFSQQKEQLPVRIYTFHVLPLSNPEPTQILLDANGVTLALHIFLVT